MELKACRRRAALVLALALALLAAALSLPVRAFAEEDTTTQTALTSDGGELSSGSYVLVEDVTLTTDLTVPSGATVTIDLNGHTLTGKTKSSTTSVITVYGTLTITDSSESASGVVTNGTNRGTKVSSKYYGAGVYVVESGSLTLEAGTISGSGSTSSSYGGGVCVYGTFTMSGGSVSKNTATYGGGVYVAAGATFTMSGGSVGENTAGYGGGVYAASGATVTMSGSSAISSNTASSGSGGGAFLQSSVTFTMSDSSAVSGNTAAKSGGGIYCGSSGTTITISDGSVSENTASGGSGGGIYLSASGSGTLTIDGGKIKENTATGSSTVQGGGIYASKAALTFSGGSISENTVKSTSSTSYGGGIYVTGGTFTMSGGEVTENVAHAYNFVDDEDGSDYSFGGGISIGGSCTATISGGTISDNTANRGGGVCVYKASLTLKGGTICSNNASVYGGGVYTQGDGSTYTFVMTGGSVCDNTAAQSGGGICLFSGDNASNVIYAGTITGNVTEEGHGGGIYVNTEHTVTLYNVVITENTASILGGGIWACNTGGIEVYVTEGGAVYGNDAQGSDGTKTSSEAGDDIASVTKKSGITYVLSLASRILGGGAAAWYEDGAVSTETATNTGTADESAARYGEDSEEVENPEETTDSYALKDIATGTALAVAEATTIISGNSAPRGGGIGANGNVIIGDADAESTSVTVTKTWDDSDDIDDIRPESVTVNLYNTVTSTDEEGNETSIKYLIDTAVLSADNNWTYVFDELPVDGDYAYSVEEEVPAGYEATYSTTTAEDGTTTVAITNTHEYVTTSVAVTKVWNDSDNTDNIRPESVTVALYADGEATGLTVTLSEDNGWSASFEDLPVYAFDEDGNATEIEYTVVEDEVEGYESAVTGSASEGFTVTNTHEVTADEEEPDEEEALASTGDAALISATVCAAAGAAAVAVGASKRRKRG